MTEEQGLGSSIGSLRLFLALGGMAIWLVLAGIVATVHLAATDGKKGAVEAASRGDQNGPLAPGEGQTPLIDPDTGAAYIVDPTTGEKVTVDPVTGKPVPANTTGSTAPEQPGAPTTTAAAAPKVVGDSTGISQTEIKLGMHAPMTIGGAPLNLAEDPIKGVQGYIKFINERQGGIYGRKIILDLQDDKYETSGGEEAARKLIEHGNFIISGTLGVDQINAVAQRARDAKVPYHAAGGHEPDFAKLGLYQIGTSYDTHVIQLARWMANEPTLKGKKVGVSVLDSPLLLPVYDVFKAEADRLGIAVGPPAKIKKPTEQSSYTAQINQLKSQGTEVFIPMQDPISTSRMVKECSGVCNWTYTFSDFATESDTALTLMNPTWANLGVKGMAAACYYLHPNAYDPGKCAHMDNAHAQWVAVYNEADWKKDGQGGASGYQIVSLLAEALRRTGPNPTREAYRAAIQGLDKFNDIITSPITFAGRSSYAHGSDMMAVYQANPVPDNTYRQITPGLVLY